MVYDKSLYCKTANQEYCKCTTQLRNKHIQYGIVGLDEFRKQELQVKNNNPVDIIIYQIVNKIEQIKIILLDIQNEDQKIIATQKLIPRQGSKEQPLFTIKQGQIATFSFVLNATMESNVDSEIFFRTSQEDFSIPLSFQIIPGQVLVEPKLLRFEQSFKGILAQRSVSLQNTFKQAINIKQITSQDERFYFKYDNSLVIQPGEKTKAFEIFFNSSYLQGEQLHHQDQNYENKIKKILQGVTYKDLNKHFKQVQEWKQFEMQQQNDIKTQIKIETSFIKEVILEVEMNMTQPIIIKEDMIDFGLNQINKKINKQFTIYNPSDYPLQISFFISTSDFFQNSYLQQLFSQDQSQEIKQIKWEKIAICAPEIEKYRSFEFYKNLNLIFHEGGGSQIQEFIIRAKNGGYTVKYPMDPKNNSFMYKNEVKELIGQDFYTYLQKQNTLICKLGNIESLQKHLIEKEHLMKPLIHLYQNPQADKKTGWKLILGNIKEQEIEIEEISKATQYKNFLISQNTNLNASSYQKLKNFLTDCFTLSKYPMLKKLASLFTSFQNQQIQQFFLEKNNQIVEIPPHSNYTFQDLYFTPQLGSSSATLFIKNILTGLNLIPIQGQGGIGQLEIIESFFFRNIQGKKQKNVINHINPEYKHVKYQFIFVIRPDEISEQDLVINSHREFIIQNTGKLPVNILRISENNYEQCGKGQLKLNCNGFKLDQGDKISFSMKFTQSIPELMAQNQQNISFDDIDNFNPNSLNTKQTIQFYTENFYFEFLVLTSFQEFQNIVDLNNEQSLNLKLSWFNKFRGSMNNFLPFYAKISIFGSLLVFVITIYYFLTNNIIKTQKNEQKTKRIISKLNLISNYAILERQIGFKVSLKSQPNSNLHVYNIKAFVEKAKKIKETHSKNSYSSQPKQQQQQQSQQNQSQIQQPQNNLETKQKTNLLQNDTNNTNLYQTQFDQNSYLPKSQNIQNEDFQVSDYLTENDQNNNLQNQKENQYTQEDVDCDNQKQIFYQNLDQNQSYNKNKNENQQEKQNQEEKEEELKYEKFQQQQQIEEEINEKQKEQISELEGQTPIPKQKNKKNKKQEKKNKRKEQKLSQQVEDKEKERAQISKANYLNKHDDSKINKQKLEDSSLNHSLNQSQTHSQSIYFKDSEASFNQSQNYDDDHSQSGINCQKDVLNKSISHKSAKNFHKQEPKFAKQYSQQPFQQKNQNLTQNKESSKQGVNMQQPQVKFDFSNGFVDLQKKVSGTTLKTKNLIFPQLQLNQKEKEKQNIALKNEWEEENIDLSLDNDQNQTQVNENEFNKISENDKISHDQQQIPQNPKVQEQSTSQNIPLKMENQENLISKQPVNEEQSSENYKEKNQQSQNQEQQNHLDQSFISQEKIERQINSENSNQNSDSDSEDQLGSGESLNDEEKFDDKNNFGFGIKNEIEKINSQVLELEQLANSNENQSETISQQNSNFSKFQNEFFNQKKDSQISFQREDDSSNAVSEDDEINFKYFNLFKGGKQNQNTKSFLQRDNEQYFTQDQQSFDIRSQNKTNTLFGAQNHLNQFEKQQLNQSQSNNSDSELSNSQNQLNMGKLDSNQSSTSASIKLDEPLKLNKQEEGFKNPFNFFFKNNQENLESSGNQSEIFQNQFKNQNEDLYLQDGMNQQLSKNTQLKKNQDFYENQNFNTENDSFNSGSGDQNTTNQYKSQSFTNKDQGQNYNYSQQLSLQNPMLMYSYLQQQQKTNNIENYQEQFDYDQDLNGDDRYGLNKDINDNENEEFQFQLQSQDSEQFNPNYDSNPQNDSYNNQQAQYQSSDNYDDCNMSRNSKGFDSEFKYHNQSQKQFQVEESKEKQSFQYNNSNSKVYRDYQDDEEEDYYQEQQPYNNNKYYYKNSQYNKYHKNYQNPSISRFNNQGSKYQNNSNISASTYTGKNYQHPSKFSKLSNSHKNSHQKGLRQGFSNNSNSNNYISNNTTQINNNTQKGSSSYYQNKYYQNNSNNNSNNYNFFNYEQQNYQEDSEGESQNFYSNNNSSGGGFYYNNNPNPKKKDFQRAPNKKPFRAKPYYKEYD